MSKVSEKQLEANKQNALKGGVKTEEGKNKIRLNALKHGLLSKETCLEEEDRKALERLAEGFSISLEPNGELELILVDRIVAGVWRLRRSLKIERNVLERQEPLSMNLDSDPDNSERTRIRDMISDNLFERLLRYETTIERGIYRALHELQRLQAMRRGQAVNLPIALDVSANEE